MRFLERLNPRQRQLVRYVELRGRWSSGEMIPLAEWKYFLYFLEIECHALRRLVLRCPVEGSEGVLESLVGDRVWVRKRLQIETFGESEAESGTDSDSNSEREVEEEVEEGGPS
jgi:hypothetical protein